MRKEHLISIAFAGLLAGATTACAMPSPESSPNFKSPNIKQVNPYSLEDLDNIYRITRVDLDTFLVTDRTYGPSYAGSSRDIPLGIEYMRSRGCEIPGKNITMVASTVTKVETNNGENCLPELK